MALQLAVQLFFDIQPEEGSIIRAEMSYLSFWVAGDERELWKISKTIKNRKKECLRLLRMINLTLP